MLAPGLGMDSAIWADPAEAKLLGGLVPIGKVYGDLEMRTLYHDLADEGFAVHTWGPRRPVGPLSDVVDELLDVVEQARNEENSGIILIGHSRGGLASRIALPKLIEAGVPVRALVTIASPHKGSGMARWASFLAPFASFVDRLIPEEERKTFASAIKRTLGFLSSAGVRELLPDSELLRSLRDEKPRGVRCISAGGTDPTLVEGRYFSIPGTLEKILPDGVLPAEMIEGKGDGLVTDESAMLPFADEHLTFHKNHLKILLDEDARGEILGRIEELL